MLNNLALQFSSLPDTVASHKPAIKRYKDKALLLFSEWSSNLTPTNTESFTSSRRFNLRGNIDKKKIFKWVGIILAVVALVFIVRGISGWVRSSASDSGKVGVKEAKARQDINKELTFPLKDAKGDTISNFRYKIETVELRDEVIVQGQKATSVKGRTFLLVNLKLANDYNGAIKVNTRDFVRLSVNGNESEWLAPDMHNDPVEIQAISTKNTRVGFPINESDTNLILQVGEINGSKEKINLELQ